MCVCVYLTCIVLYAEPLASLCLPSFTATAVPSLPAGREAGGVYEFRKGSPCVAALLHKFRHENSAHALLLPIPSAPARCHPARPRGSLPVLVHSFNLVKPSKTEPLKGRYTRRRWRALTMCPSWLKRKTSVTSAIYNLQTPSRGLF